MTWGGMGAVTGAVRQVTLSVLLADYVYFENSSSNPYLIRRIEELNKVVCAHVHVVCAVCARVCVVCARVHICVCGNECVRGGGAPFPGATDSHRRDRSCPCL